MSTPAPSWGKSKPARAWGSGLALAGLLLLIVGLVTWGIVRQPMNVAVPPSPAVLTANNRGVGHMEQYDYPKAVAAFEEVVRQAPDWLPGQINLGIALLNKRGAPDVQRAVDIFHGVLRREPDNPYAHFCLGIIFRDQAKTADAVFHFEAVTRIDPRDAAAWYWLGNTLPDDEGQRILQCFEQAHELNPYLKGAIYGLAMQYRATDPKKRDAFLADMKRLDEADWSDPSAINYTEMGRYAEVIGPVRGAGTQGAAPAIGPAPLFFKDDSFAVKLAGPARWATAADLKGNPNIELQARVRERFGAVLVPLDFNGDDKTDLLLLGAVVDGERIRDLLLRNDGRGQFNDVTADAGLAGARTSLACCTADFDNDGFPDIAIAGTDGVYLFRNNQRGGFDDVTKQAGLDQIDAICLGVMFADLDQDGDLDLVLAMHTSRAGVGSALKDGTPAPSMGLGIYLNVGKAPPAPPDKNPPPLTPAFKKLEAAPDWLGKPASTVNVLISDLDRDGDIDVLALRDGEPPTAVLNDRLLRFRRETFLPDLMRSPPWNGGLVLDANSDGIFDLMLTGRGERPLLLLGQPIEGQHPLDQGYRPGAVQSPPLLQGMVTDIDLDGFFDVVGLSDQHRPVLLHNAGGPLVHAAEAFGRDDDWPKDIIATRALDLNDDAFPDLLFWSAGTGLHLHSSRGNGNHALRLRAVGQRRIENHKLRTNRDGIGVAVTVQTGNRWTNLENSTLETGLGQSRQPLLFGLGKNAQADIIRLRWPDNTRQAEFGHAGQRLVQIEEANRKTSSCPVLFAWDGRRFGFITDFLGAGTMGELQPDGTCRPPRPEESIKIEPHQLKPRDGKYVLKLAEPMDEVTYLDRLELVVLDHPADVQIYPDERLAMSAPAPSQELLAFREPVFPLSARDQRGNDMTETLRHWDRRTVDGFARRSWLGIAEEHYVHLDFGDRLARFAPKDRLILCLAGWTDYAYPESIWAATQAGVPLQAPVLERRTEHGWEKVAEIGFPAGLPRMMTYEVTGKLVGPQCVLRLRTNLEVYWDQVFLAAVLEQTGTARAMALQVESASLSSPGCMLEYSPDGREPTLYDYDRWSSAPMARLKGKLTRLGDVTDLLRQRDDRFVIFGPGDEITVYFDATQLPSLRPGWRRSFVLRTWGYCKDTGPFTATGDTIEPLPFAAMKRYPYGRDDHYPADAAHKDYLRQYQTRESR